MPIMIKTPNGRIAFDQNRKITETTETITINDNVTISLPQSLRELMAILLTKETGCDVPDDPSEASEMSMMSHMKAMKEVENENADGTKRDTSESEP